MDDFSSFGQVEFSPLAVDKPPVSKIKIERDDALKAMADLTNPQGDVDPAGVLDLQDPEDAVSGEQEALEMFPNEAMKVVQNPELTFEQKLTAIDQINVARENAETLESQAISSLTTLEESSAKTIRDERRARFFGNAIQDREDRARIVEQVRIDEEAKYPAGSYSDRAQELAIGEVLLWPKSGHYDVAEFMNRVAPEVDAGVLDHILQTGQMDEVNKFINTLPEDQVRQRLKDAQGYLTDIAGTFGTDNYWESQRLLLVIEGIFGDNSNLDSAKSEIKFEQVLNIMTAGILGGVAKFAKASKGALKTSPAKIAAEAAPESSDSLIRVAIDDTTGKAAESIGANRQELLDDYTLTNGIGEPIVRGPDIQILNGGGTVQDTADTVLNLKNAERLATAEEVKASQDILNARAAKHENVLWSKSSIGHDDKGSLRGIYSLAPEGQTEFATYAEAVDYASTRLEAHQLNAEPKILGYDAATGDYLPIEKGSVINPNAEGGFLVQAEYRQSISDGIQAETVVRKTWAASQLDTTVSMIKRVADSITNTEVRGAKVEQIMVNTVKPFKNLSRGKQNKVVDVLREGDTRSLDYTEDHLLKVFKGDAEMVKGFQSFRKAYDILHLVRNHTLRNTLQGEGYSEIDGVVGATYVRPARNPVRHAYDVRTGLMREVKDGEQVMETFRPHRYKDSEGKVVTSDHVIVTQKNMRPLSNIVLPKRAGYIGSHLDINWVARKKITGPDGSVTHGVVQFSKTSDDIQKWRAGQDDAAEIEIIQARESEIGSYNALDDAGIQADFEILGHSNSRSDIDKLSTSYTQNLISPEDALAKDIITLRKQVGGSTTVDYLQKKFTATYGDLVERVDFGRPFVQKTQLNDVDRRQLDDARVLHDRIRILRGDDQEIAAGSIKDNLLLTAERLARAAVDANASGRGKKIDKLKSKLLSGLSRTTEKVSNVDLLGEITNVGFLQFIVARPFRQLAIQSATSTVYSALEGGAKYAATGKWAGDQAFISMYKAAGINPKLRSSVTKSYAKVNGISTEQAAKFADDFWNSGLIGSIQDHQYLEAATKFVVSRREISARNAWDVTKSTLSRGFEMGEATNLMSAYLVVRNRKALRTGKSTFDFDPRELEDIAIEARQVAGNMGQANKAKYQTGFLRIPFQFQSYGNRMVQFLMPDSKFTSAVSSPILSNEERGRMVFAQAALWGTGGLGVSELYHRAMAEFGVEPDERVDNIVEEGLIGLGLESLWEESFGESSLGVSEAFSPLGGIVRSVLPGDDRAATSAGLIYEQLHKFFLEGEYPTLEVALGPSGQFLEEPNNKVSAIYALWTNPVFTPGEKFKTTAENALAFFPQISDAYKARIAHKTGLWVNSQSNPLMEAQWADVLAKGVFGINPEDQETLYDLRTLIDGEFVSKGTPESREIRQSGADTTRMIASTMTMLDKKLISRDDLKQKVNDYMALAYQSYGGTEEQWKLFKKSMLDEGTRISEGLEGNLYDDLYKKLETSPETRLELSYEKMVRLVRQLEPSPRRDFFLSRLDDWFANNTTEIVVDETAE